MIFASKIYLYFFVDYDLNFFWPPIVFWMQVVTQTQFSILFWVFRIRNLVQSGQLLVVGQWKGAIELDLKEVGFKLDEFGCF